MNLRPGEIFFFCPRCRKGGLTAVKLRIHPCPEMPKVDGHHLPLPADEWTETIEAQREQHKRQLTLFEV